MFVRKLARVTGPLVMIAAASLGLAACEEDPDTSIIHGTVDQGTIAASALYPSDARGIIIHADDGNKARVNLDGDSFTLELAHDHSYRLELEMDGPSVPIAMSGAHGWYELELGVFSGGASVDLGSLRLFDGNVDAELAYAALCVDGYFEGTAEPCVEAHAEVFCGHGRDDDDDGGHDDDDDFDGGYDDDYGSYGYAGENVYDGDELVSGPVAVPEYGLPDGLSCGRHRR